MEKQQKENNKWKVLEGFDSFKADVTGFFSNLSGKKGIDINWKEHGFPLVSKQKLSYTKEDKKVLKYLLFKDVSMDIRKNVRF